MTNITRMPQYQCFKKVHALKIAHVVDAGTDTTADENPIVEVTFVDSRFAPRKFNLRGKPTPEAGWYFVVYENGYHSFSPEKAFEEGYMLESLIPEDADPPAPTRSSQEYRRAVEYEIDKARLKKQGVDVDGQDHPLSVAVAGNELVIRIGVDVLAHAANESDAFNPYDEKLGDWRRRYSIDSEGVFADDVARELQREAEDGSSPISRLLDKMTVAALEDGSLGVCYEH